MTCLRFVANLALPFPEEKRTVPFQCVNRKRQVQFRSTFGNCWVSTGTRKCILFTKLSQYIRETLFPYWCFLIFRNKLSNFNFSEPQNSFFFSNFITNVFFLNFFNHKLSPFRRSSMNVVDCLEIFCMHF